MSKKSAPVLHGMKLEWWQVSLFKISTISFGILVAYYFEDTLRPLMPLLWVTMIVPGVYLGYLYLKK